MKIFKIILVLSLIISLFPLISSVSIELNKNYDKGETLIAKVSGNFVDNIQKSNIFFYRLHMPTSISEYDVVKIQNNFYIYAKLNINKIPDNYSLQIKNVRYMDGAFVSSKTIIGNFSIVNNLSDFWVSPGAKIVDQNYSLKVQNLQSKTITINIDDEENETVFSGEIKNINFNLDESTSLKQIKLSSENTEYLIPIYNFYNPENLTLNETNNSIDENSTIIIDEIIGEDGEIIIDEIIGEDENSTENDEIIIINDEGEEEIITTQEAKLKTCEEINGNVCLDNETCEGSETDTRNSSCCLGDCVVEKKSNTGRIIGYVLIGVVAIIIFILFRNKSKKKSSSPSLLSFGKK